MRRHLLDDTILVGRDKPRRRLRRTACNRLRELHDASVVDDPALVDCLQCIQAIERFDRELSDEVLAGRARPQAKQRALKRLAAEHHDEFDQLVAEELPGCIEELRRRELSYRAYVEEHGW